MELANRSLGGLGRGEVSARSIRSLRPWKKGWNVESDKLKSTLQAKLYSSLPVSDIL